MTIAVRKYDVIAMIRNTLPRYIVWKLSDPSLALPFNDQGQHVNSSILKCSVVLYPFLPTI